ncbi:MAG: PEP-CTERM sorting domain-containing protein [Pirellulales bacterium]
MRSTLTRQGFLAMLACALLATWITAAHAHSDLEVEIESGQLATEYGVFEGEFNESANFDYTNDPGFEAHDGTMTAGATLGFNAKAIDIGGTSRNLWYWDGSGGPAFGETPNVNGPITLDIHLGASPWINLNSSSGAGDVTGFDFATADGGGEIHDHLDFTLLDGAQNPFGSPAPAGVYLFALELTSDSYATSDPFYMVFGSQMSHEQIEEAVDFVATTFNVSAAPEAVPEPGTLLIALIGSVLGGGMLIRRRRRAAA